MVVNMNWRGDMWREEEIIHLDIGKGFHKSYKIYKVYG